MASVTPVPNGIQDGLEIGPTHGTAHNVSIQAAAHDQTPSAAMIDKPTPNRPTANIEPGTLLLFGLGLAGLAVLSFTRKQ